MEQFLEECIQFYNYIKGSKGICNSVLSFNLIIIISYFQFVKLTLIEISLKKFNIELNFKKGSQYKLLIPGI